jgi:hypothetical protein
MLWAIACSFLTVAALIALGYKRGGNLQMAKFQVQNCVLLLMMSYLLAVTLRRMKDFRILAAIVIGAPIKPRDGLHVVNAVALTTTEGDSILRPRMGLAPAARVTILGRSPRKTELALWPCVPSVTPAAHCRARRKRRLAPNSVQEPSCISSQPAIALQTIHDPWLAVRPAGVDHIRCRRWSSEAKIFAPVRTVVDATPRVDRRPCFEIWKTAICSARCGRIPGSAGLWGIRSPGRANRRHLILREYEYSPRKYILDSGLHGCVWIYGLPRIASVCSSPQ